MVIEFNAYIGIKLANKGREVVVLEITREQIASEDGRIPNNEGRSIFVPRDDIINGGILDELVSFGQKRRGN